MDRERWMDTVEVAWQWYMLQSLNRLAVLFCTLSESEPPRAVQVESPPIASLSVGLYRYQIACARVNIPAYCLSKARH